MSLLLLFNQGGAGAAPEVVFAGVGSFTAEATIAAPEVVFAGVGSFSAAGTTVNFAAVAFAATGSFSSSGTVVFAAAVRFPGGSTFTVAGVAGASVTFRGVGNLRVSVALDYRVDVVDMNGSVFGTLVNARVANYSHELNGAGTASFALATTDPAAALVRPGREIQIWRNGILQWWGPVVRPQAGLRETTWGCAGLAWYLGRRFMGRADRINLLTNGDFEAGEASWTFVGGVGHAVDTALKVEGSQSLRLSGATADHVSYATQTMPAWSRSHPDGDFLTVSTWVYVPSAGYLGGAVDDVGLVAIRRNAAGVTLDAAVATIGDDTEKDVWIPLEVGIPSMQEDDTIEVRLFPPHGSAYFDLVTLTAMESLSFWPSADVATVVAGIVRYAQGITFPTHGKSDLNIGVSAPATGVIVNRTYQFAEHRNIADAINEFVHQGVIDVDIVITPTTRTFTTYAPRKGVLSATPLVLDENLADFSWSWDGENAASSVVVLGPGDGPDRPEGGASDTTFLDGLTLEIVESAPDDVTVGELDDQAAERLTVTAAPEILEVTTLPGVGVIGNLLVGDTVPVKIRHGWLNIDAVYRVARIEVDPMADQAALTLNPAPA